MVWQSLAVFQMDFPVVALACPSFSSQLDFEFFSRSFWSRGYQAGCLLTLGGCHPKRVDSEVSFFLIEQEQEDFSYEALTEPENAQWEKSSDPNPERSIKIKSGTLSSELFDLRYINFVPKVLKNSYQVQHSNARIKAFELEVGHDVRLLGVAPTISQGIEDDVY